MKNSPDMERLLREVQEHAATKQWLLQRGKLHAGPHAWSNESSKYIEEILCGPTPDWIVEAQRRANR